LYYLGHQFFGQGTPEQGVTRARNSRGRNDVFVTVKLTQKLFAGMTGKVEGRARFRINASLCALFQSLKSFQLFLNIGKFKKIKDAIKVHNSDLKLVYNTYVTVSYCQKRQIKHNTNVLD
jgi:hypothetical protein